MFLKVCCGLDLDTPFASYLLQDDENTVLLHIPDLESFSLVCILIGLDLETFFNSHLLWGYCESMVDSLVWTSTFLVA